MAGLLPPLAGVAAAWPAPLPQVRAGLSGLRPRAMGSAMQAALARNARLGSELSRLLAELRQGGAAPQPARPAAPSLRWIF